MRSDSQPNAKAHPIGKAQRHLPRAALASVLSLCTLASGCGNAWITTSDREETLAALMSKADYAYDKSRFSEAAAGYRKALAKDPTVESATIKLAYSLNGEAGLSILDFVTRFIVQESEDGSGATKLAGESQNPITTLTATVGLSDQDKEAIAKALPDTLAGVRTISKRFTKLQESWTTVCQLMPASLFTTVFESESDDLKSVFEIDKCNGGLPEGSEVQTAALFAAALQFMAQAAGLFQALLDADGNNEIDIAETGNAAVKKLQDLQQSASALTDAATSETNKLKENMAAISTQLDVIQDLKAKVTGEIVNYTLACFTFVTALIAAIPSIPSSISKKIERAASKINEGRAKLVQYTSVDASSSNTEQGKKVKEAAEKAAKTVDELYAKVAAIEDAKQKEAKEAELNSEKDNVCNNFEETKSAFNLPADIAKPQKCTEAPALTGTSDDANQPESRGFTLRGPIPLPSELNPELNFEPSTTDGSPISGLSAVYTFLTFGEGLRN